MNESCPAYAWAMSHVWTRHVIHTYEACHTYAYATSHMWMSHVSWWTYWMLRDVTHRRHMNESCHTCEWAYEWVMSHMWMSLWMSHVTHMNESCHTCEWAYEGVMSHMWMSLLWVIDRCNISAPALSWVMSRVSKRRYSAKEPSNVKEPTNRSHPIGSFSIMSHVTHMNESCHTCQWVIPHIWMSHVTHVNESCHTYEWVMWHIWTSHVTRMNESYLMMKMLRNVTHRRLVFAYVVASISRLP